MKRKAWNMPPDTPIPESLLRAGYTPLLASVLAARGYTHPQAAAEFLRADETQLSDPRLLPDMDTAVQRLRLAAQRDEHVVVYGDYDVDGITATTLLTEYLRGIGIRTDIYIPDRLEEGYGLNRKAIDRLRQQNTDLIVTVDCGVTAIEETRCAVESGIDVIITDHHECMDELPPALAVVNPKRADCVYPQREIAGVMVALKLVCAMSGDTPEMLRRYADLAAMGTVADVMPLQGENRYIVSLGLEKLRTRPRPGIAALMRQSGITPDRVSSTTVGYTLSPRINAAGRLGLVRKAAELMLEHDPDRAEELAGELCDLNRERQQLEAEIWEQAHHMLRGKTVNGPIVLAGENWHQGIIGIAASRLAEEFSAPTVIISVNGEICKGSCRSFGGFNLFEALGQTAGLLEEFGGHALAAGLNIRRDRIGQLRQSLQAYYDSHPPTEENGLSPEVRIHDAEMLSPRCIASLDRLEPCGSTNPRPIFCLTGARLLLAAPIAGGRHTRLRIEKFRHEYECVWFSHSPADFGAAVGDSVDIVFTPQISFYRGRQNVQLVLQDLRRTDVSPLCRQILIGRPSHISISRTDITRVWRSLEGICPVRIELPRLGDLCPQVPQARIAMALRILSEIDLISLRLSGNQLSIMMVVRQDKADLSQSVSWRRYHI